MQKIQYLRDYNHKNAGDIDFVSNNIAHGLVEKSIAILYKDRLFKSPIDKMMRSEIKLVRRSRKTRYRTK